MANWYYTKGGRQTGPMSEDDLRRLVAKGDVEADDLIWRDGMGNWLPVRNVPEFGGSPPPVCSDPRRPSNPPSRPPWAGAGGPAGQARGGGRSSNSLTDAGPELRRRGRRGRRIVRVGLGTHRPVPGDRLYPRHHPPLHGQEEWADDDHRLRGLQRDLGRHSTRHQFRRTLNRPPGGPAAAGIHPALFPRHARRRTPSPARAAATVRRCGGTVVAGRAGGRRRPPAPRTGAAGASGECWP